jgi:integrase
MHLVCIWQMHLKSLEENQAVKLTAAVIRNYRLAPGMSEKTESDDDLKNGYARFRMTGNHSYDVCHGTPRKWRKVCNLAGPGALALDQARVAGMDFLTKLARGEDPAIEKAKARIEAQNTFGALVDSFVARQRKGRRKSTADEAERYLNDHAAPLHPLPVKMVDLATAAGLLADVEKTRGPGARNNLRNYASSFYGWMRGEGLVDTNPFLATNKAARKSRDRLLSDVDARAILTALDGPQRVDADFGDIVKTLFLTGLRRDEVAKLEWREVDFDRATIIISGARMKNHREHATPMSDSVMTILRERHARLDAGDARLTVFGRRDTGFSGFSKAKRQLDQAIAHINGGDPIEWVLHDIRRYVSTTLNERLGIEPHIVEVILAHYPKGVSGVYNRSQYAIEKRRALDKLAGHLEAVTSGGTARAKVIGFLSR